MLSYAREADIQIVGLVKDHRARTPAEHPKPMIYLPYLQRYQAVLTLVARANRDAGGYAMAIREAARSLDPALPPYHLRTLATERAGHSRVRTARPRSPLCSASCA